MPTWLRNVCCYSPGTTTNFLKRLGCSPTLWQVKCNHRWDTKEQIKEINVMQSSKQRGDEQQVLSRNGFKSVILGIYKMHKLLVKKGYTHSYFKQYFSVSWSSNASLTFSKENFARIYVIKHFYTCSEMPAASWTKNKRAKLQIFAFCKTGSDRTETELKISFLPSFSNLPLKCRFPCRWK